MPRRWSPKPAKQKSEHFPFNGKQCTKRNYDVKARMMMILSSSNFSFSRRVLSPERGVGEKQVVEDYELCSPPSSSAKSSVCREEEVVQSRNEQDCLMSDDAPVEEDDDDIMSCYVIEINDFNCDDRLREETVEAVGVDEAIAWAKEKYQSGIQLEKYHSANHPGTALH